MNLRPMLTVNAFVVVLMAGVSAWAWTLIPDAARVPVHWGITGEADRFGSKEEALLLFPVLAATLTLLLWVLPRFDPRRANLAASGKFWNAAAIGAVLLLAYVHVLVTLAALGKNFDMIEAIVPALSALFIVLGNYLSKTRSNFFAGVRTPWTLSSEHVWEKTHRWSGRLFVVAGLAGLVAWIAAPDIAFFVVIASVLASSIAAVVLSYVFWKADPGRAHHETNGS